MKEMHKEAQLSRGQKAGARETEMSEVAREDPREMWTPKADVA